MASPNHLTLEQKHSFIEIVLAHDAAFAEVCRDFRISRQTGYKWLERYHRHGLAGLAEQSRRPRQSPHATAALCVERLRLARRRRKRWGAKKLRAWLQGQHPRARVPSASTLGRLLRHHGWSHTPLWRRRGPERAWPALRQARCGRWISKATFIRPTGGGVIRSRCAMPTAVTGYVCACCTDTSWRRCSANLCGYSGVLGCHAECTRIKGDRGLARVRPGSRS